MVKALRYKPEGRGFDSRLMYELKKNGKVFTSKFVGTGPSSCKKRIYRAAVSQRLRNTALNSKLNPICHLLALLGVHHIVHVSRIRVKVN